MYISFNFIVGANLLSLPYRSGEKKIGKNISHFHKNWTEKSSNSRCSNAILLTLDRYICLLSMFKICCSNIIELALKIVLNPIQTGRGGGGGGKNALPGTLLYATSEPFTELI